MKPVEDRIVSRVDNHIQMPTWNALGYSEDQFGTPHAP